MVGRLSYVSVLFLLAYQLVACELVAGVATPPLIAMVLAQLVITSRSGWIPGNRLLIIGHSKKLKQHLAQITARAAESKRYQRNRSTKTIFEEIKWRGGLLRWARRPPSESSSVKSNIDESSLDERIFDEENSKVDNGRRDSTKEGLEDNNGYTIRRGWKGSTWSPYLRDNLPSSKPDSVGQRALDATLSSNHPVQIQQDAWTPVKVGSSSTSRTCLTSHIKQESWARKVYADFTDQTPSGSWWKISRGEASPVAWPRTQTESKTYLESPLSDVTSGDETHDLLDAAGWLSSVNISFNLPPYRA